MPAGSSYHYQGTCRMDDNNIKKMNLLLIQIQKFGMLEIYMLDLMEQLIDQLHVTLH